MLTNMVLGNVHDRRISPPVVGSRDVVPLDFDRLTDADIGRTVIYWPALGGREAGTVTGFRDGLVWARYSTGDTSAAALPNFLYFEVGGDTNAD